MAKKQIQKGEVRNPNGRPKGALNKNTKVVQDALAKVMNYLESTLIEDIDKISPQRRLQLYTNLMVYIKPKLAATKQDIDVNSDSKIQIEISYISPPLNIDDINQDKEDS